MRIKFLINRFLIIIGVFNIIFTVYLYAQTDDKVDINTATKEELASLPGLGPLTAERIVEYRKKNNGFKSIDDLIKIKGIGQERLSQIKLWATVSIVKEGEKLTEEKSISETNKLNINAASRMDLELLPGIGPKIAENIVEYRTQNKGFKTIQELLYMKGIGEKKFNSIKDLIKVEDNFEK